MTEGSAGIETLLQREKDAKAALVARTQGGDARWRTALDHKGGERYDQATRVLEGLRADLDKERAAASPSQRDLLSTGLVLIDREIAQAIYNNPEMERQRRFELGEKALLAVLGSSDAAPTETLRLLGAVAKRRWQSNGRGADLDKAITYYRKAHDLYKEGDAGYGAVNAAYLLSIRARQIASTAQGTESIERWAATLQEEATSLYQDTVERLSAKFEQETKSSYWTRVTCAECLFGLGRFKEAEAHLRKARSAADREPRNIKVTFDQMTRVAELQGARRFEPDDPIEDWSEAWQVLSHLLDEEDEPREKKARAALRNRPGVVGLALSGGGFRAALFHLGVLARLAEMDALRNIDILSTVSGGSIVGAHYCLKLRKLLMEKPDLEIHRDHYIGLVEELIVEFLAAIQSNIRMQAFADPKANLKMAWSEGYSRTYRLGELYEKLIYSTVGDDHEAGAPRLMKSLKIQPKCDEAGAAFKPKAHNWRRAAKAPILLLNATSLNSGHHWRFTASWMGEPPGSIEGEVDKNLHYPWASYCRRKNGERSVTLGDAVAASSCVPGLFEPLPLIGLYDDGTKIQLVDGGVHDNQGLAGLVDEGCDLILCSDASGQLADESDPQPQRLAVLGRTNSVLMDRVRETQYADLSSRASIGALEGFFFTHLKQGLVSEPKNRRAAQDTLRTPDREAPPEGIDPEILRLLSEIRTDLDSFGDLEAHALMYAGYRAATAQFQRLAAEQPAPAGEDRWCGFELDGEAHNWPFKKKGLLRALETPRDGDRADHDLVKERLKIASKVAFKPLHLLLTRPVPRALFILLMIAMALALGYLVLVWIEERIMPILLAVLGWVLLSSLNEKLEVPVLGTVIGFLKKLGSSVAGLSLSVVSRLYLRWLDPIYKRHMKVPSSDDPN